MYKKRHENLFLWQRNFFGNAAHRKCVLMAICNSKTDCFFQGVVV